MFFLTLCSLIVAAPGHEVENLVADLLPLLSYSAPFAIYHQYLEVNIPRHRVIDTEAYQL
jgi:hypothetical protein